MTMRRSASIHVAMSLSLRNVTAKNPTMFMTEALRKNLCKNNQPQKNDFVVRAADQSLSFLFSIN